MRLITGNFKIGCKYNAMTKRFVTIKCWIWDGKCSIFILKVKYSLQPSLRIRKSTQLYTAMSSNFNIRWNKYYTTAFSFGSSKGGVDYIQWIENCWRCRWHWYVYITTVSSRPITIKGTSFYVNTSQILFDDTVLRSWYHYEKRTATRRSSISTEHCVFNSCCPKI